MLTSYSIKPVAIAATMACTLFQFTSAFAEDFTLEEVVVSGSRASSKLSETPQAIGVVRQETIQRDKPKTMGDVINRIPGVYWNELGNEQHSMGIRQPISTNAVYQYLEDGIPIRPLGVFNHNSLNEMNLMGTDSVEVVKGAASSLYGSNAVGGAVNFITAAPTRKPFASIGIRHDDTNGFIRYDTAASNTWGPLGLRFAHYSSRRTDNWQAYSQGSKDSFTLRGDYVLNPDAVLRASLVHTDLDTATSGSLSEADYLNNPGKSLNSFSYRKDKTTRMNVAWEGETIPNGMTTVTLFARQNDHGQLPNYTIRSCSGSTCVGTLNNNHVDSLGLDIKHEQPFAWLSSRLIAGVFLDKSQNPYVSDNLSIVRDPTSGRYLSYTVSSATSPTGVRDFTTNINNTAVFAQWESTPATDWRVVLGARSDGINYKFQNHLAPNGSAAYGAPNESRSFSRISPKLGATYLISRSASVYANVSQGFTPPEVSQLYGATGIPNLRPATYNNYEIGLRQAMLNGALKLDAAIYRLEGKDTIVSYRLDTGNSENRNAGRTRSEGLELGLTYASGAFDARLGTAISTHRYLQYQTGSTSNFTGKSMPQAPRDITTMEVGYQPATHARVALEVVHQGAYWMDDANTQQYPGHTLLNLRGNMQLGRDWTLWAQARNLTDKRYADSASKSNSGASTYSPGAPRSLMVGVSYQWEGL